MQLFSSFCVTIIEGDLLRPKDGEMDHEREVENLKTWPDGNGLNERKI
jgi:hypothetical protein